MPQNEENAYLAMKTPRASRSLRQALDPDQLGLTSFTQLCCVESEKWGWGVGRQGWGGGGWGGRRGGGWPPLPTHPPLRFTREQTRVEYIRRCRLTMEFAIICSVATIDKYHVAFLKLQNWSNPK